MSYYHPAMQFKVGLTEDRKAINVGYLLCEVDGELDTSFC